VRIPPLYAIIDPAQAAGRSPLEALDALLRAGVGCIQYRDKRASSRELYEVCLQICARVRERQGVFIVNDRADVALAVGADGVHLGQEDLPVAWARRLLGPRRWIGCSTHNLPQVRKAEQSDADYVAFGPIFPTSSKEKADPVVGLDGLRAARQATSKPLVAIGGITLENAPAVVDAGADSLAVIGDLIRAEDLDARAAAFLKVVGKTRLGGGN
jgi:thiamine-phosphate pyrophosphorylase